MTFLSKFDIFKQPVQLSINNDNKVSTNFGKLVTFFMVFYTIYTLLRSDLVLKKNPRVKVENYRPLMRPHLNFNNSNFTFAVGLYDLDLGYLSEPTMFSYSAGILLWDNSNNNFVDTKLDMDICKETDFVNAGENFKGTFQNNLFCFQLKNESIHLFGSYNERMIRFIYLNLERCRNSTENNFTCKSPEQQENYLQGRYQDFIFQNDAIDYSNYDDPLQKDITKYFVTIDLGLSKIITAYVKHFSFLSDKGFFFEEQEKEDSYLVESVIYDFQSNNFEKENKPLARLEVYSDSQETTHSRKFQHIQDLLAEMGGVLNIFILFGMLAINFEIPYIMTKRISSELYAYQATDKIAEKYKKQENGEDNKDSSNLESRNYSQITKTITLTDISPIDAKAMSKKMRAVVKLDLHNETKELSAQDFSKISSLENKDKQVKFKPIESTIFSNRNMDINFSVKIPKLKGDEEVISGSEEYVSNNNNNIQFRRKFSVVDAVKMMQSNTSEKDILRKKVSFMQTAYKFSIDLKNKLNIGRLLESQTKGKKNFPINFFSYLSILVKCKRFKLSEKEKLFLLGENQIQKDLDIFKIINCMNDVEKLKMILLNDKQRYLFYLLQKPIITTKQTDEKEEVNPLIVSGRKKKHNRNLAETFYKDLLLNKEKSEIDSRILVLLDKNILNVTEKL